MTVKANTSAIKITYWGGHFKLLTELKHNIYDNS